jgi:hypothetical protein
MRLNNMVRQAHVVFNPNKNKQNQTQLDYLALHHSKLSSYTIRRIKTPFIK